MSAPRISVIMPVRNGARFLAEAVSSLIAQSFAGFELLAIDDGSTDETAHILARFQKDDPRIRVLNNPGAGLVDALNHGIASASAKLIARMDADDICLPDRLQRQYDYMQDHPEIDVLGTQVRFIDEQSELAADKIALPLAPDDVAATLLSGCCLRHPSVMMRKEALERTGGYRRELVYAEDYDLWLRMSEQGLLANLPDVLLLYRVHSAQISEQKEWSQRLARNLALLSAIERRESRQDPIGTYACFEKGASRQLCRGLGCRDCVCESVRAFDHAQRALFEHDEMFSRRDIWQTLRYVSQNSMGDGQRSRVQVLVALCRQAARQRAPLELAAALALALRIHPGRAIRGLATTRD